MSSPIIEQNLEEYPVLKEALSKMKSPQLEKRANKSLRSGRKKDDLIMAVLLTAAQRSENGKLEHVDMTKLQSLVTSGARDALNSKAARAEWADFVYSAYYRKDDGKGDEFRISARHCPMLCELFEAKTGSALQQYAAKMDTPPGSSTKKDFVLAAIRTAARRAAAETTSDRKGRRVRFDDSMVHLRAALNKEGKDRLGEMQANEKDSFAVSVEWIRCVQLMYFGSTTRELDMGKATPVKTEPAIAVKTKKAAAAAASTLRNREVGRTHSPTAKEGTPLLAGTTQASKKAESPFTLVIGVVIISLHILFLHQILLLIVH